MPDVERVQAFMATVEAGHYVLALETFYAPHATMRENGGAPRGGRDVLIAGEHQVLARHRAIRCQRLADPAIAGDQVAIAWRFEFDDLDGGSRTLEEVAWQTWSGGQIVDERFFYDPGQLAAPVGGVSLGSSANALQTVA